MPTGGCPTGRASPSGSRAGSPYHRPRPRVRRHNRSGRGSPYGAPGVGDSPSVDGTAARYQQTSRAAPSSRTQDLAGVGATNTASPAKGVPEQPLELHAVSTPLLSAPSVWRVLID